ncbi:hypothetical protein [Streptomyces griseochromogenes]|uniref:hypothetical protein n=1 Tax=Streptomyces griseochromogenes TaxID=68214 RepID=UPI0037AA52CE
MTGAERNVKRNTRDDIYNIFYSMELAQRLAADLYYPGCLSLERKRAAVNSLATWERPAGMRAAYTQRRWSTQEDRVLLQINNPAAAADELGRTVMSCGLRLWRLRTGQVPMPSGQ